MQWSSRTEPNAKAGKDMAVVTLPESRFPVRQSVTPEFTVPARIDSIDVALTSTDWVDDGRWLTVRLEVSLPDGTFYEAQKIRVKVGERNRQGGLPMFGLGAFPTGAKARVTVEPEGGAVNVGAEVTVF